MPLWSIQEQTFNDEASQLSFTFTSVPESDPGENGGEGEPQPSTCVLIVGNGARNRELVIMFDRGGFKVKSDVVDGQWTAPAVEEDRMPYHPLDQMRVGGWKPVDSEGEPGPPEVYDPLPPEAYKVAVPSFDARPGPALDPAPLSELAKILGL